MFQGVLLIENIQISSFFIVGVLTLIVAYFYVSFCHEIVHNDDMIISLDNNFYKAIVDSGNRVWYKGYPIIFIASELVKQYDVVDTIYVDTAYKKEKVDIVLIKKIDINFETFYNVYAGKMNLKEYDCILNTYLLGGVL